MPLATSHVGGDQDGTVGPAPVIFAAAAADEPAVRQLISGALDEGQLSVEPRGSHWTVMTQEQSELRPAEAALADRLLSMVGGAAGSGARFAGVSLDCADPLTLAGFYLRLLGGEVLWHTAESVGVRVPGVVLAMQRIDDYRPPAWPGSSVVHLDLAAGEGLEGAVAGAVDAGAILASHQPDSRWRVLLDPAGHPFCLTTLTPPDTPMAWEKQP